MSLRLPRECWVTLVLGVVLLNLCSCIQAVLPADEVDQRLDRAVAECLGDYKPDPAEATPWYLGVYALAALHGEKDVALADECVRAYFDRYEVIPFDPCDLRTLDGFESYFPIQLIWRIYCDPDMNAQLSEEARAAVRHGMWDYINTRSFLRDAKGSVWRICGSENHDAMKKTTYLLGAQELMKAGAPWGPQRRLADGHTLAEHAAAWSDYWVRYFKARAGEGINCELASAIYAKYTVGCYYNVRDFADSETLRRCADDFITLYWADTVSEYLSCGIRGGAQTRIYKNKYLTQGSRYPFYNLSWAYGWRDGDPGQLNFYAIIAATSDYRVPEIITACANNVADHSPYMYSTRRFGLGDWVKQVYAIEFEDGDSYLRRDSYVTSEYVLGTFTMDPARNYNLLLDQNRLMGVFFANDAEDRIVIHGKGAARNKGLTGMAEINGLCGPDCMVVARDPGFWHSDGMRVFISDGSLLDNLHEVDGWLFTETGGAFCGVRIAHGGYTKVDDEWGVMLELEDVWAPIIVQTGLAQEYGGDIERFKAAVKTAQLVYDEGAGRTNYVSIAGDRYSVTPKKKAIPLFNGKCVELNPQRVYDSPFLQMSHGSQRAVFRYPGYEDLALDFSKY